MSPSDAQPIIIIIIHKQTEEFALGVAPNLVGPELGHNLVGPELGHNLVGSELGHNLVGSELGHNLVGP